MEENSSSSSSSSNEEEKKKEEEDLPPKPKTQLETEDKKEKDDKYNKTLTEKQEEEQKTLSQKIKKFFRSKPKEEKPEHPLVKDENLPIEDIIVSKGFKCQTHTVKTEDGYTLVIFRIPGGKNCEDASKLPPVLLQHGI